MVEIGNTSEIEHFISGASVPSFGGPGTNVILRISCGYQEARFGENKFLADSSQSVSVFAAFVAKSV